MRTWFLAFVLLAQGWASRMPTPSPSSSSDVECASWVEALQMMNSTTSSRSNATTTNSTPSVTNISMANATNSGAGNSTNLSTANVTNGTVNSTNSTVNLTNATARDPTNNLTANVTNGTVNSTNSTVNLTNVTARARRLAGSSANVSNTTNATYATNSSANATTNVTGATNATKAICAAPICRGNLFLGDTVIDDTSFSNSFLGNSANDQFWTLHMTEDAVACANDGRMSISTCGSKYDTWLRLYSFDGATEIYSCDDCGDCGFQTVMNVPPNLTAGANYVLLVEGFSSRSGEYTLSVSCATPTSMPTPMPSLSARPSPLPSLAPTFLPSVSAAPTFTYECNGSSQALTGSQAGEFDFDSPFVLEMDVATSSSQSGNGGIFEARPSSSTYGMQRIEIAWTGSRYLFQACQDTSWQNCLIQGHGYSATAGSTHTLRFDGTSIVLYVDGVAQISRDIDTSVTGAFGVETPLICYTRSGGWGGWSGTIKIENLINHIPTVIPSPSPISVPTLTTPHPTPQPAASPTPAPAIITPAPTSFSVDTQCIDCGRRLTGRALLFGYLNCC